MPRKAPAVLAAALWLGASAPVAAQATRTWVSGVGDDVNPCSRTAPCKTFAGAISKTASGGEIDVLDPGGFGSVTITKSITIDGGSAGGILSSLTNGVVVNGAGIVVTLRNLVINGAGNGTNGISALNFAALHLDNVQVSGVTGSALHVASSSPGQVVVRDSRFSRPCAIGYRASTTTGTIAALLTNVTIEGCTTGIDALARSSTVVRNSAISHAVMGVAASAGAGVAFEQSAVSASNNGVVAHGGTTTVRLSRSTVVDNVVGLSSVSGGTLLSFGNNVVHGNGTNGAPTSTLGEQ